MEIRLHKLARTTQQFVRYFKNRQQAQRHWFVGMEFRK